MRIAIDAMGGDHAPHETVAGAIMGLEYLGSDDQLILVGQEDRIQAELDQTGFEDADHRLSIIHASQIVAMGDNPVDAMRQKRDSSIAKMTQLAANGEVDAIISAGNTGACVAACQMMIRPLKGVHRPGIAVVFPSFGGPVVLCDVGANVAPKPHHLHQYALMCAVYAERLFDLPRQARVALLSVGEEDAKGNRLVKEVRDILKADSRINFSGYVEGRSLLEGQADVVVCDGFVGNVVLKLMEGLADGLIRLLAKEVAAAHPELVKGFGPILKKLWEKHDYSEHGGAPLLGVDGVCIICHGSSDRRAIRNAVDVAHKMSTSNINKHIVEFINSDNHARTPSQTS